MLDESFKTVAHGDTQSEGEEELPTVLGNNGAGQSDDDDDEPSQPVSDDDDDDDGEDDGHYPDNVDYDIEAHDRRVEEERRRRKEEAAAHDEVEKLLEQAAYEIDDKSTLSHMLPEKQPTGGDEGELLLDELSNKNAALNEKVQKLESIIGNNTRVFNDYQTKVDALIADRHKPRAPPSKPTTSKLKSQPSVKTV